MGRPVLQSWPGTVGERLHFERGVRAAYPTLRGRAYPGPGRGGFRYDVIITVPFYGERGVTIVFRPGSMTPQMHSTVAPSPHRFSDTGGLCAWDPNDPSRRRWQPRDGLLDLLDLIVAHSFREEWWLEYGEWLGDEAPHDDEVAGAPTSEERAS